MDSAKFLGRSLAVAELVDEAAAVAASDARILVTGEHGVGKSLLARMLHERSRRCQLPIVPISCSLPEPLLEAELFGPARPGAEARDATHGLLALANGGTVVLDEVGEMSPRMQKLLLRFLDSADVRSAPPVRILATSSCDLYGRTQQHDFSEDLFYRLNVVHLVIPSLRERREDVPVLWEHFVATLSAQHNLVPPEITTDGLGALQTHLWPGNVRELRMVADRMVVRYSGRAVAGPHVLAQLGAAQIEPAAAAPPQRRLGATPVDSILPGRPTLWSGLRGRASGR